jgi:hypothetical protein
MSNFFDPASLFGGGGSSGGSSAAAAGSSVDPTEAAAFLQNQSDQSKPVAATTQAYGFGTAGSDQSGGSQFNRMRQKQMGMGGG